MERIHTFAEAFSLNPFVKETLSECLREIHPGEFPVEDLTCKFTAPSNGCGFSTCPMYNT